jgi:polyhydroxyalkanoate synthesis regulator phasin
MRKFFYIVILLALSFSALAEKKTVDQLRAEAEKSSGGHQAELYAELAGRLVDVADQQFTAGDSEKGQSTVQDILANASRAHDVAVSSRKKLKQVEIHLREAQRHLENMRRTLAAADRPPVEAVEKKLADYRQDLLNVMFAPNKRKIL